jgi:Transposase, Mutator family
VEEFGAASLPAANQASDSLIAGAYLAGTNTRRVRRALSAVFGGAVSKDTVSRVWRKVKGDWDAWNARPLAGEPIIRLILDGTVVRVRLYLNAYASVAEASTGIGAWLASTMRNASTRAWATARRGKSTKRAYGYVDKRLRRPAALPPLPEQTRKAGKCSPSPTYP